MWLPNDTFKTIIANTPLISIDFIVRNKHSEVLLGRRTNAPAQGVWFVPGGRIQKDERLDDAFKRLLHVEMNVSGLANEHARFLGVYEHFYPDNTFDGSTSTHYIVLGYEIYIDVIEPPLAQHALFKWWSEESLLESDLVHQYTKDYFSHNNTLKDTRG